MMNLPVDQFDNVLVLDNLHDGHTDPLLTVAEVAKLLNVSATSVRRLQQQRNIPFIKVGGSVRFLNRDVLTYIQQQRVLAIE